jgi:hypothetical protein
MVTAYSPILKLALPVQGELSGTWGDVVNDNITSMVEQAIAGRAVINTWTTNSHTLTTANGTTSESRCAMLEFTDTGTALSGAGTVICPTLSKIYIAKNASGQNVTLKTSGGTGILVPNGRTMFLFCDGTNVVEAVTSTTSLQLGTSTIVTAVLDEDNMASDSATSLATQQSIKAYVDSQVGANNELSEVLANGNTSGANDIIMTSGQKITTNTIDETTAASGVTIDSVLLKDDGVNATNLEITNIKANDGTAAGSIADSTGVVTILSSILTTADINGGTADGVIIGGTTPAAATVTNLIANTDLIIAGTTTITAVLDEDNMASDSATALATQQSIKAYVDSQVGTVDTLAEILAIGNTTGATDIAVDSAQKVQFRDAAIYINSSVDGQLDIVADTEIQIAATTVDLNGALDVSGTLGVTGVLTATSLDISGDIDVDGTTNLDVVDIDGATQIDATVTVGVDDTGYDVKFFGATAGAYMLWDESADDLILGGAAGLSVNSAALVTGVLTTTAATVFNGGFAANQESTIIAVDGAADNAFALIVKNQEATDGRSQGVRIDAGSNASDAALVINDHDASTSLFRVKGSGVVEFVDGTASLPSITNFGDLNTGIFFPAADTIAFSEGGTEAMRIDSSQRLLIGFDTYDSASDPGGYASKLMLQDTSFQGSSMSIARYGANVSGGAYVIGKSRGAAIGSNAIVVDDDYLGNVIFTGDDGVNMSSQGASIRARVDGTPGANDMPGRLEFNTTADGAYTPTERMRISSGGQVNIGDNMVVYANPNLQIRSEDNTAISAADLWSALNKPGIDVRNSSNTVNTYAGINFFGGTSGNSYAGINMVQTTANSEGALTFWTGGLGAGSPYAYEAMRINSSRMILIGATSNTAVGGHQAALQVVGSNSFSEATVTIQGNENNSNGAYLGFSSSRGTTAGSTTIVQDDDTLGQVYFVGADGTDLGTVAVSITAQVDGTPGSNDMPGRLVFSTTADGAASPTERMRIDSSGTVILSTLGSALQWNNGYQTITGDAAANDLTYRTYQNHIFKNTTGAGSTTDGTERMRIDSSGRVLIGITTTRDDFYQNDVAPSLQVEGSNTSKASISATQNAAASADGPRIFLGKTRGTGAQIVSDGDRLGALAMQGADGADLVSSAEINGFVDGTPGANDMPGRLQFSTTADGAASPTEHMRINKNGFVGIGGATDPSYQLDVKKAGTTFARVIATNDNTRAGYLAQAHTSGGADVNMSMGVFGDASQGEISMATNHPLLLYTNNDPAKGVEIQVDGDLNIKDGNLVVANGHGIDFSATSGTGTSELLDDYEEGTWAPTFAGSGATGVFGYSTQNGYYEKIGKLCHVHGYLVCNSVTSNYTGVLRIAGLPFTNQNTTNNYSTVHIGYSASWATAAPQAGHTEPSTTYAVLKYYGTNGNAGDITAGIAASDAIIFSITYRTA